MLVRYENMDEGTTTEFGQRAVCIWWRNRTSEVEWVVASKLCFCPTLLEQLNGQREQAL